jgi:hypothetical protein
LKSPTLSLSLSLWVAVWTWSVGVYLERRGDPRGARALQPRPVEVAHAAAAAGARQLALRHALRRTPPPSLIATHPTPYGDEKVANRETKVWHGATENGP